MDENMRKRNFYGGMIVPTHISLWKKCRQTYSDASTAASAVRDLNVFPTGGTVLEVELHSLRLRLDFLEGNTCPKVSSRLTTFNLPVL